MSYRLATIDREGDQELANILNKVIENELFPGEIVKLLFLNENGEGDRMWVILTDKKENYLGCLINDPVYVKDLQLGDEVSFGVENIIDIKKDYPENIINSYKEVNLRFVKGLKQKIV